MRVRLAFVCDGRTEHAVVDEHPVDLAEGALVAEPVQRARAQHRLRLRVAERQALGVRLERARLDQRLQRRAQAERRLLVAAAFARRVARARVAGQAAALCALVRARRGRALEVVRGARGERFD